MDSCLYTAQGELQCSNNNTMSKEVIEEFRTSYTNKTKINIDIDKSNKQLSTSSYNDMMSGTSANGVSSCTYRYNNKNVWGCY